MVPQGTVVFVLLPRRTRALFEIHRQKCCVGISIRPLWLFFLPAATSNVLDYPPPPPVESWQDKHGMAQGNRKTSRSRVLQLGLGVPC